MKRREDYAVSEEVQVRNASMNLRFHMTKIPELQFLREFTQNGIEAILQTPSKQGKIVWAVVHTKAGRKRVPKITCIDTGCGMDPERLQWHTISVNETGSGGEVSFEGNRGMGGRISSLPWSPFGVEYTSRVERGKLHRVRLVDNGVKIGLTPIGRKGQECIKVNEPEEHAEYFKESGTRVIFFGKTENEDTATRKALGPLWIPQYLNSRYRSFPAGIDVSAYNAKPVAREYRSVLVRGLEYYLRKECANSSEKDVAEGVVELASGADVYWYVMPSERSADKLCSYGLLGIINQHEVLPRFLRQQSRAFAEFGISSEIYKRLVILVDPKERGGKTPVQDPQRKTVLYKLPDGGDEELPWNAWAEEFSKKMPDEIAVLLAESESEEDPFDDMELDDYPPAEIYIPRAKGQPLGDGETRVRAGSASAKRARPSTGSSSPETEITTRAATVIDEEEEAEKADEHELELERFGCEWVENDELFEGSREKRASAHFTSSGKKCLHLNPRSPILHFFVDRIIEKLSFFTQGKRVQRSLVEKETKAVIKKHMVRVVTSALRGTPKNWSLVARGKMLGDWPLTEAFTSPHVVIPFALDRVKKQLGIKLQRRMF